MNKKIVVISDFDSNGSGYRNICIPLLTKLAGLGYDIKVAGLNYMGEEHNYPFSIIPAYSIQDAHVIANNLCYLWEPDILLVAMDIPLQEFFYNNLRALLKRTPQELAKEITADRKYIAITPLENGPLTMSWAAILLNMDYVFFISELGKQEALKAGLSNVDHLVIGVDTVFWHPATSEEKKALRSGLGIAEDEFVVLTVADNQERKNLWAGMESVKLLKQQTDKKVRYIMVTRPDSPVGWKLNDLAVEMGLTKELMLFNRGLPVQDLWGLYAAADVYLQPSKAEGLCVLPDNKVWTQEGRKNIQDVKVNDYVITDTGEFHSVSETFSRQVNEQIQNISMGFGLDNIKVTSNHPILAVKNLGRNWFTRDRKLSSLEYVRADQLEKGDFVFYPKPQEYDSSAVYISDYVENIKVDNGLVYSIGRNQFGSEFTHPNKKQTYDQIKIDKDFCSLLGWFVAEGCDTGEGLSFSLHWDEVEYREHIRQILKIKFDLEMKDYFKDRNRYDGRVYGTVIGKFFSSMCGKDATTKHLPEWALWLDESKSWSLLQALFSGDGTYSSKDATLRYSTTSKELSRQIQFILFRMGIVSSVRDSKNRLEYVVTIHRPEIFKVPFLSGCVPNIKKSQKQFIELHNGWLFPVRSNVKEQYKGEVYNLEVNDRHNYLLSGGVVHNCMPVLEAMACGIPCVATNTGALTELLENGRGFLVDGYDFGGREGIKDVWGNSLRSFINIEKTSSDLCCISESISDDNQDDYTIIQNYVYRALEFVRQKTWDTSAQQFDTRMKELFNEQK